MTILERLDALYEKATPGEWRICRSINNNDNDRAKIDSIVYGIAYGERRGPFKNVGHFHPDDAQYFIDENHVVEISHDRDYGYAEGAIAHQPDAKLIAALHNAYPALRARIEVLEAALGTVNGYIVESEAGRINWRPSDAMQVIRAALAGSAT